MKYLQSNAIEQAALTYSNITNVVDGTAALIDPRTNRRFIGEKQAAGDAIISAEYTININVDIIGIIGFGFSFATFKLFDGASEIYDSGLIRFTDPVQQRYICAVLPSTLKPNEIQLIPNVSTGSQFSIGYFFAGSLSAPIEIANESLVYRVTASDPQNIARDGRSVTSNGYRLAEIDVTTVEQPFSAAQSLVQQWSEFGFFRPRPWVFTEQCILTDQCLFAAFDSETLQIEPTYYRPNEEARATMTFGLRESF